MFYNFRKNKKAFTLVELIVVIAIIAILGAVVGVTVSTFVDRARKSAAKNPIDGLYQNYDVWTEGTFKNYIKTLYPNDYTSFYVSDSSKLSSTSFGSSDSVTVWFHNDDCGKYWGQLEIKNGKVSKPGEPLSSAPSAKTQLTA